LVPHTRHVLVVSDGKSGFSPTTVTRSLSQTGSSSRKLRRLFRVLPSRARPAPPGVERLPWGCGPSSRHQPVASLRRGSMPVAFRPRRFARPRRFLPPPALWVCFTPQPRPGFALQGFVPLAQPYDLVGRPCPLVVDDLALPTVAHRRHALSPRPQGFHPCGESGVVSAVFSRRSGPIPSWASPPPGCSLSASSGRLHALGRSWSW